MDQTPSNETISSDIDDDDDNIDDDIDDDIVKISPDQRHGEVVDLTTMPGGEIYDSEHHIILFEVPIITPCGDVVVSQLSFEVGIEIWPRILPCIR